MKASPQPPLVAHSGRVLLGVALCLLLAACAQRAADTSRGVPGTRARTTTARVERRDFTLVVTSRARAVAPPGQYVSLVAPFTAPVAHVYATVGQSVKAGDALLDLSYPTAESAYEQARAEVRQAEEDLRTMRRQLDSYVASAETQVANARHTVAQARDSYHTTVALQPTSPDLPNLQANLQAALAARMTAEQNLTSARQYVDQAVAPYEQRLAAAQANFQGAQQGKRQATVSTPISGQVLRINAGVGQTVQANAQVATVARLSDVRIEAPLDADQAAQVETGMRVDLQIDGLPAAALRGRVTDVRPDVAAGLQQGKYVDVGRYLSTITFDNSKGLVKPDMTATASFTIGHADSALVVPTAALRRDTAGTWSVMVQRDGRWVSTPVQVGLSDARSTTVTAGLQEGDLVQVPA